MLIELDPAITTTEAQFLERKLGHFFADAKFVETRSHKVILCDQLLEIQESKSSHSDHGNILRFPGFEADPESDSLVVRELSDIVRLIDAHPRVRKVHGLSGPHKLVSSLWRSEKSLVPVGSKNHFGNGELGLILGPCAIEGEQRARETLHFLKQHGVRFVRGGAFKPRTSAYSFRGLGLEGLKMFSELAKECGIRVVSEVLSPSQIDAMYEFVDIFQVGARNSQNFALLHELGKVRKPVLLKRALAGTVDELLHSAEHVFSSGNQDIILCERGIRTFEPSYRNTLDLNAIPFLKQRTHLPVIVDPSHGTGSRDLVESMSLAAIMAGADGLLVEIHDQPEEAFSDGAQSLRFDEAARLIERTKSTFELRCSFESAVYPRPRVLQR